MTALVSGGVHAAAAQDPAQYLTFQLRGEVHAIGILAIKEIIEYGGLTAVPMMPAAIRGVINLRGAVVPVLDLALRFGKPAAEPTKRTCIVIVETALAGERTVVGIVVDSVNAVQEIAPADIEPPPSFGMAIAADFVSGMGKVGGRFVVLLDLDQVLAIEGLAAAPAEAESTAEAPQRLAA
jgi:purine-binding chemotaxis protein CheW